MLRLYSMGKNGEEYLVLSNFLGSTLHLTTAISSEHVSQTLREKGFISVRKATMGSICSSMDSRQTDIQIDR
jgi:dihydroxyacetone kinase